MVVCNIYESYIYQNQNVFLYKYTGLLHYFFCFYSALQKLYVIATNYN